MRTRGTVEIVEYKRGTTPLESTRRFIEVLGADGVAYPGFSVQPEQLLDKQIAAGTVTFSDGKRRAQSRVFLLETGIDVEWSLPDRPDVPASVTYSVNGREHITVRITPVQGARALRLPATIVVKGLDQSEIIQIFEYLDQTPDLTKTWRPEIPPAQPDDEIEDEFWVEDSVAGITRPVDFGTPREGLGNFIWDSGWQPGGPTGADLRACR